MIIPLLALNMVVMRLRFDPGFTVGFFVNTGKVLLMAAANSAMAIGFSLANPAWTQKSPAYMINMQIIAFLALGFIIVPKMVLRQEWLQLHIAWVIGIVMLYMGYRKLSNMEYK